MFIIKKKMQMNKRKKSPIVSPLRVIYFMIVNV